MLNDDWKAGFVASRVVCERGEVLEGGFRGFQGSLRSCSGVGSRNSRLRAGQSVCVYGGFGQEPTRCVVGSWMIEITNHKLRIYEQ